MSAIGRAVRGVAKIGSYVAPAAVGFMTGNPWLVGVTAGGMSAARGENLQRSLLSGAISGVASYAGSTIGSKASAGLSKLIPNSIANSAFGQAVANSTLGQSIGALGSFLSKYHVGSAIGTIIGHQLSHPKTPSIPEIPPYAELPQNMRTIPTFDEMLRQAQEKVDYATRLAMIESPRDIMGKLETGQGRFESPIYEPLDIKPIEIPDLNVKPIDVKPFEANKTSAKSKLSLKELAVLDIPEEGNRQKPAHIERTLFPKKRPEIDIFNHKRFPPLRELSKRQQRRISLGLQPIWKDAV